MNALGVQSGGIFSEAPAPPTLPAPPALESVLFESPWLVSFLLFAGGAVLYLVARHAKPKLAVLGSSAAILSAFALVATSFLVTTDRERLAAATESLVWAVARADSSRVGAALTDNCTLTVLDRPTNWSKTDLLRQIETSMTRQYAVRNRSANVSRVEACIDGSAVGRTQFRVQAVHDSTGAPVGMWWRINWRRSPSTGPGGKPGEWKASGLDLVSIDGVPAGTRVEP